MNLNIVMPCKKKACMVKCTQYNCIYFNLENSHFPALTESRGTAYDSRDREDAYVSGTLRDHGLVRHAVP